MAIISFISLMELGSKIKDAFKKVKQYIEERKSKNEQTLIVDNLNSDDIPYMTHNIEEKKAIAFCKEYHLERKWCYKYKLDLNAVKEEK